MDTITFYTTMYGEAVKMRKALMAHGIKAKTHKDTTTLCACVCDHTVTIDSARPFIPKDLIFDICREHNLGSIIYYGTYPS